MRGGWRWNSGRRGWRGKVEERIRLDLRRLKPGAWEVAYTRGGEKVGSLFVTLSADQLVLRFMLDGQEASQKFPITTTACNFGGTRPWLSCPFCTRRCLILYSSSVGFGCRRCLNLAYTSQSEDACGRSWRRQQKAEAKLGKGWSRPKGMHNTTRQRLLEVIFDAEMFRDDLIDAYCRRHPEPEAFRGYR